MRLHVVRLNNVRRPRGHHRAQLRQDAGIEGEPFADHIHAQAVLAARLDEGIPRSRCTTLKRENADLGAGRLERGQAREFDQIFGRAGDRGGLHHGQNARVR